MSRSSSIKAIWIVPEFPTGRKTIVLYLCSLSLVNKRFSTMGKETDTSNYSAKSGPVMINSWYAMILLKNQRWKRRPQLWEVYISPYFSLLLLWLRKSFTSFYVPPKVSSSMKMLVLSSYLPPLFIPNDV